MSEVKPFASLTPGLLARKGAARPAMRPQLMPISFNEPMFDPDGQEDLGWNDMGHDLPVEAPQQAEASEPVVTITPETVQAPVSEAAEPEVLRQMASLATAIKARPAPQPDMRADMRVRGSALKEGRKAAFTLRLDAERHLRLRLACTLDNRSAQQVVVEALDLFLEAIPGLDDLARRARRS